MRIMSSVLIISLLLITSSCGVFKGKPDTVTKLKDKETAALNLPYPEPVNMKDVDFIIITPDNASKKFAKLLEKGIDPSLWCVTDVDYQNLSQNHDEIQRYIVIEYKTLQEYKNKYDD